MGTFSGDLHRTPFGKPIFTYSRKEALADGVLINVTNEAKIAGFKIPVAVTHEVWDQYIKWTNEDNTNQTVQHQSGRLWDVLWMLFCAIKTNRNESEIRYSGSAGINVISPIRKK